MTLFCHIWSVLGVNGSLCGTHFYFLFLIVFEFLLVSLAFVGPTLHFKIIIIIFLFSFF